MSVPKNPLKYDVDYTGYSPDHFVRNEKCITKPIEGTAWCYAVMPYGGFYADSLRVYSADGLPLRSNYDYFAEYYYERASRRTGQDVAGCILINATAAQMPTVLVTAQMVGGTFADNDETAVSKTLVEWFKVNPINAPRWNEIIGSDSHLEGDLYEHELWRYDGYEILVSALENLNRLLMIGTVRDVVNYDDYFVLVEAELNQQLTRVKNILSTHDQNKDNPHHDSINHLGLGKTLPNWGATDNNNPAIRNDDASIATAKTLVKLIETRLKDIGIENHTKKKNPHGLTAASKGAYTKVELAKLADGLLPNDATAANANTFSGLNFQQLVTTIGQRSGGIRFDELKGGPINPKLIGTNDPMINGVLTSENKWVNRDDFFYQNGGAGRQYLLIGNYYTAMSALLRECSAPQLELETLQKGKEKPEDVVFVPAGYSLNLRDKDLNYTTSKTIRTCLC